MTNKHSEPSVLLFDAVDSTAGRHAMFCGTSGAGKTAAGVEVVRVFFARADVSQLKEQYGGEAGDEFAGRILNNCSVRVSFKPNKEHE